MPRILADLHHEALYHSLSLLFEKRLGWELYRPRGPEWYTEGYWKVFDHPATVAQYLGTEESLSDYDSSGILLSQEDGIAQIQSSNFGTIHHGIRLEKFKNMEFDIILSSMPQHVDPYQKLLTQYQPHAKHIFQIGNNWSPPPGIKNVLASTMPTSSNIHTCFYHQEVDLSIFKYEPPTSHTSVNSYVHGMNNQHYLKGICAQHLPAWKVKSYGAGMDDSLNGAIQVAEAYKNSGWTVHHKPGGDGFGHTIFSSYACGRPLLVWQNHYKNCNAEKLFTDLDTCINLNKHTGEDLINLLKYFSQPEEHKLMCEKSYKRFCDTVDYDAEEKVIRKFIEDLK